MGRDRLKVKLGGLSLKNPIIAGSGIVGYGTGLIETYRLDEFGAIILKGTTLKPRAGNPPPRLYESPCGLINSIGLENPGIDYVVSEVIPELKPLRDKGTKVILNIAGEKVEEYVRICEIVEGCEGLDGIELNLSCPNVSEGGIFFGTSVDMVREVTSRCREVYSGPLIVKLSPLVSDIVEIANSAVDAGADILSPTNTLPAIAVDVERQEPVLGNLFGGLSGPAIKPVLLRQVLLTARDVEIPVIGGGGVMNYEDVMEYILVGSTAVQVGTALFVVDNLVGDILEGVEDYLNDRNYKTVYDIMGVI